MNKEEIQKIIDEFIKEDFIVTNSKGCLNLRNNKNIVNKYKNKYNNIFTPSEYLYIFKHKNNIDKLLKEMFCKCGNKNTFIDQMHGYYKHCSIKCKVNDIEYKNKIKQTNLIRYGVDNPWKNKDIINKIKIKQLNNIDENGLNGYQQVIKKGKQTKKNKIR